MLRRERHAAPLQRSIDTLIFPENHRKPELGLHSQCLHAKELTFLHPRTGEEMTLSCPLPEEFENALKKLQRMM